MIKTRGGYRECVGRKLGGSWVLTCSCDFIIWASDLSTLSKAWGKRPHITSMRITDASMPTTCKSAAVRSASTNLAAVAC